MKVQELVELATSSKNRLLKEDQFLEVIKNTIETKEYISIKKKKELIDNIIDECIIFDGGIYKFDDIERYICFTMKMIETYTNIELSNDIEDDYDVLCKAKLLNTVIETFVGEYENTKLLFQMKCDYILANNGIEAQLGKFLSDVLEKISDVSNVASDKISKFDMNKLPFSVKDLNKLMDFLNFQK